MTHLKNFDDKVVVDAEVDSGSDAESEDEELIDDEKMDTMEKVNFDFEAFPPSPDDADQVNNLLTQIFLRTDIDYDNLSKAVVNLTPFGSVIKSAEEFADEDNQDCLYGISSVLPLTAEKNYGIFNFLTSRAKKNADKATSEQLEKLFKDGSKVGLVINERMLHFPAQIAGPTLNALKEDIKAEKSLNDMDNFIIIVKIRISDEELKKEKSEDTEVSYDNNEEALLFEAFPEKFPYFQYPVQSDVENTSKFAATKKDGITYRPFRKVCLLNKNQLLHFCDTVASAL
ncbi:unnamed protein product [Bursaphelenchus xylophilus]|uniref:(pine wood nematode) hypothetical protein n=1 Tax=Bursaphelenchus xylophilus TaxID=6326 RepID=A0A1I7RRR9_BURXY|nr:unnamed protein product [Bursaphelenchus xylophilus]CAG9123518.1 unnamed protein product [Bursaphelenchus xylophilus]